MKSAEHFLRAGSSAKSNEHFSGTISCGAETTDCPLTRQIQIMLMFRLLLLPFNLFRTPTPAQDFVSKCTPPPLLIRTPYENFPPKKKRPTFLHFKLDSPMQRQTTRSLSQLMFDGRNLIRSTSTPLQ